MTTSAAFDARARARAAIFAEIHQHLPREGPGDTASTRRAWRAIGLPGAGRILDVGCGPGAQTIDLAAVASAHITALDADAAYLNELRGRALTAGVGDQVHLVRASMFEMPFEDGCFDVIWSEGAIYLLGFERALREWRRLLRSGGGVAVTHLSWLEATVPDEPRTFWARGFPQMRRIDDNAAIAAACGFELIEHFVLPESAWWEPYYTPLEARLETLRHRYAGDEDALQVIETSGQQIELFRRFARYYGYVFYVLRIR
jgi:ubiquinone/menaquinone biosynthesis C-methylase UbiE